MPSITRQRRKVRDQPFRTVDPNSLLRLTFALLFWHNAHDLAVKVFPLHVNTDVETLAGSNAKLIDDARRR